MSSADKGSLKPGVDRACAALFKAIEKSLSDGGAIVVALEPEGASCQSLCEGAAKIAAGAAAGKTSAPAGMRDLDPEVSLEGRTLILSFMMDFSGPQPADEKGAASPRVTSAMRSLLAHPRFKFLDQAKPAAVVALIGGFEKMPESERELAARSAKALSDALTEDGRPAVVVVHGPGCENLVPPSRRIRMAFTPGCVAKACSQYGSWGQACALAAKENPGDVMARSPHAWAKAAKAASRLAEGANPATLSHGELAKIKEAVFVHLGASCSDLMISKAAKLFSGAGLAAEPKPSAPIQAKEKV